MQDARLPFMTAVELLQELLRVRSVNPPGDEGPAAEILETYLSTAGLKTEILKSPEGRSNLVARLDGPSHRPALVLLSHLDVVPVEEDHWTRDPFGGELSGGSIWGRGALDMKSIAVMHAVAAAELARAGRDLSRELIVAAVADEEAGGDQGARWLNAEHAQRIGFGDDRRPPEVLGEGAYGVSGLLDHPVIPIALGEKTAVWFDVVATGEPGHGALPPQEQAPINLASLIKEIGGFGTPRIHPVMREQFATLSSVASGRATAIFSALASPAGGVLARAVAPQLRKASVLGLLLSDSSTPTMVTAGYKSNVVPAEARASFDCRLLPDTDIDGFVSSAHKKARRRGGRIDNVEQKDHGPVSEKGPLYEALERVSRELRSEAVPTVTLSPGITDLRYFRARGATGYGWCPLVLTPELIATIHGHDERVGIEDLERAVVATRDVVLRACT